jgi:hypothetical protein
MCSICGATDLVTLERRRSEDRRFVVLGASPDRRSGQDRRAERLERQRSWG